MAANLSFFDILQINSNLNYANGRISISNFSTPELANYTKRTAASPLLSHLSLSPSLFRIFFFVTNLYLLVLPSVRKTIGLLLYFLPPQTAATVSWY
jgi:hypothetical protein